MRPLVIVATMAATVMAAELPVKTVILYKNGVGYFERAGELRAGESARLEFKAEEMNDVLKSLTVEDKSGGKVVGLRYDSSEPTEKKLEQYPFSLEEGKPLTAFLDQLKGARLELKVGAETIVGVIVAARNVAVQAQQPEREQVSLLLDSGELRTFDLAAVGALRLTDPKLQQQLKDYLGVLVGARNTDKRSVYLDSSDAGARQLIASYMIPTPVWKSSYRLIFPDTGDAMLEGWAIVDNTTGEDWTNVRLALVSGRPVSFISQLYEPKYRTRPTADLPEDQAVGPQVFAGAIREEGVQRMALARKATPMAMPAPPPAPAQAAAGEFTQMFAKDSAASSVAVSAEGRDLGDLFEYRFSQPVTVKKSESAMLPFLQQKLPARKLLIYSDRSRVNPMNAAELTNATGKTLDGGPITVFDAGAYAGEALVETFKNSDKRLISYGVDMGTRITTRFDSGADVVREVHVRRGMMTTRLAVQETVNFEIRNVDAKAKTLLIEHPARPQYRLLQPAQAKEKTPTAYRFEVKLAASATEKFSVVEERVYDQTIYISNQTPDTLAAMISNRTISDAGRKQLQRVLDLKRQVAETDAAIRDAEMGMADRTKDQERIRQNIQSLNNVSGQQELVQRYARDLAGTEGEIAKLRDRLGELRKRKMGLETEVNSAIEAMEF